MADARSDNVLSTDRARPQRRQLCGRIYLTWAGLLMEGAEDAALSLRVKKLSAVNRILPIQTYEYLCANQHARQRRDKIDPNCVPVCGEESRSECTSRIHAHSGQRGLESDVKRVHRADQEWSERSNRTAI